jgi:hypothetical protein
MEGRRVLSGVLVLALALVLSSCTRAVPEPRPQPTMTATGAPFAGTQVPPAPTLPPPTAALPPATEEPPTPTLPPPTPTPELMPQTVAPTMAGAEPYDDRSDPVRLLASLFNAVNRREFQRAWGYWENPPNASFLDFIQGYADTVQVLLAASPPTGYEGAAGSQYATVPALLWATHVDGSNRAFYGCYVAQRPNPEMGGAAASAGWLLYSATVSEAPDNVADAALLFQACAAQVPGGPMAAYEDRSDPVRLLASYFNAVNVREFQRAWGYWDQAPNPSYEDFIQGYADTVYALLAVYPSVRISAAAGTMYAEIPTLLVARHVDGSEHAFYGCYVARRPTRQGPGGELQGDWSLFDSTIQPAPANSAVITLLTQTCPGP